MANDGLKAFYTDKYAHERSGGSQPQFIEPVDIPTSRNQAAVHFLVPRIKGGYVMEMGCGRGDLAKTLLRDISEIEQYTLADLSLSRVEGLKNKIPDDRVSVLELDAENIPESECGKYDCVIMVALIEHLIDPLNSLKRIRDLLVDDGFIYIETPNVAKINKRLQLLRGRFPSTSSTNEGLTQFSGEPVNMHDEGHLHYFTFRSLSLMLTEHCGYSNVEKLPYPTGRTPLGKRAHAFLARMFPELFSSLVVTASK